MYQSKMAIAVKASGRVLREKGETVFIPFGSEYSLQIKNLNSVRALVKVWIDGTDATEGTTGIIVQPNTSIDLERFIKNGNLSAGNKFKFIERTPAVSNHRGNKVDDGLIRVEFEFEKVMPVFTYPTGIVNTPWPSPNPYGTVRSVNSLSQSDRDSIAAAIAQNGISGQLNASYNSVGSAAASYDPSSMQEDFYFPASGSTKVEKSDVGITVPGAASSQQFSVGAWFPTDGIKHAMVLQVLGEVEGQPVVAPITVKTKPTCTSCGKVNKATAKFCSECGTGLQLI